jgi:hypothetical protein
MFLLPYAIDRRGYGYPHWEKALLIQEKAPGAEWKLGINYLVN